MSFLPEEFSFAQDKPKLPQGNTPLDWVYEHDIPIFMANTKNANVLSYSFDSNKFIFGQLFGSINEIYYETVKHYLNTSPIFEGEPSSEDVIKKIYSILDNWRVMNGGFGTSLSTAFDVGSRIDLYSMSSDIKDIIM